MKTKRETLILYLLDKVEEGDWHGVSDAANDLRVMEAKEGRPEAAAITMTASEILKKWDTK